MKFNICLIQPHRYIHSLALLEAAEYVLYKVKKKGIEAELVANRINETGINIIFGAHIDPSNLKIPKNSIIFNTEQLTENSAWTNNEYKKILDQHYIWDYSIKNLNCITHANKSLINFYYLSELSRINLENEKKFDLLFYGSINERRRRILEDLEKMGLNIKVIFGVYAKARDQYFSECKAILNLHFYESQIFQQIRTFYPLINNLPVISENFPLDSAAPIYKEVIFTPNDQDLCRYVKETLENQREFNNKTMDKLALFKATESYDEFNIALFEALSFFKSNNLIPS
jgi:hypothetical protein